MASYLYRTAQPFTLATFRSWGSSTGAGRIRLAAANIDKKASPPDLLSQREYSTHFFITKQCRFQIFLLINNLAYMLNKTIVDKKGRFRC